MGRRRHATITIIIHCRTASIITIITPSSSPITVSVMGCNNS
jgi:hypothetical protein